MRLQFRDIPTKLELNPNKAAVSYRLDVTQTLKIREAKPQKTLTEWDLSISYNSPVTQGLSYTVQFSDPIYNGSKEYTKLEWIYARIFRVFRTIDLVVSPNGQMLCMLNKEDIIIKWIQAKKHIYKLYNGPSVDELVTKTEDLVYHKLDQSLLTDPLFTFLFNDIYMNYGGERVQVSEKQLTGHFGTIPYPILEHKTLETSTDNDLLALVKVTTDLQLKTWPAQEIDHYLGNLIGDLDTTDYLYARKGSYLLDFKDCHIIEGNMEVIGKIPNVYSKQTVYNLKQKS